MFVVLLAFKFRGLPLVICGAFDYQIRKFATVERYNALPPSRPPVRIASKTALGTTTKNFHDIGTEVKRIKDESGGKVRFEAVIPLSWVMKPIQTARLSVEDCLFKVEY